MITLEEYRKRHLTVVVEEQHANGLQVIEGPRGEKGEKGEKGDPGESNIPGPAGRDGIDGKDGKDGKDGQQGPAGQDGKDGKDGANGADGLPGVDGKDGKDGLPGRDGVDGKDGADGAPGKDGQPGVQGPPGPAGKDGVDGKDGAQGPQGIQGPAGKDGVSITSAVVNSTGNLIITKSDGTTVDAGKVSTTATTTTAGGPPVVGSAPNPFAPIVVTAPPGYKAANLDDGVELTLDTLSVQLPTSGARSLQFKVTSGTMSVNISGQCYWSNGAYQGNYSALYWNGNTLNTTWQQIFSWSFPWANDKAVYSVMDLTNRRYYRITLIIGPGYKKNFIIMERLV